MSFTPPKQIKGIIFIEIIPEFLHEFNTKKLVELGAIVRKKGRNELYEPLTDSLRKIQWVKLVGLKAMSIEQEIADAMEPDAILSDPLGQTAYALCVTDCLIHTKSALDSMAVFLTDLLNLNVKGGERDFKKTRFRQLITQKDSFLKHKIKKLEQWFEQLQEIRDVWIHRSSIRCRLVHGPNKIGILPIPKKVALNFEEQNRLKLTEENFWSTKDFIQYHYSNLLTLFLVIIDRSLQLERQGLKERISIPAHAEDELALFPFTTTKSMTAKKVKFRRRKSLIDW
jgi:hypothetical protein